MISLLETYDRLIATGEAIRYAKEQPSIQHILTSTTCAVTRSDLEDSLTRHEGNPYTSDSRIEEIVRHEMKSAMAALEQSGFPIQTPLAKALVLSAFSRTNRLNVEKLRQLSHTDLLVRIQSADRAFKRTYTLLHRSSPSQICGQMDSLFGGCVVRRVLAAIKPADASKTA